MRLVYEQEHDLYGFTRVLKINNEFHGVYISFDAQIGRLRVFCEYNLGELHGIYVNMASDTVNYYKGYYKNGTIHGYRLVRLTTGQTLLDYFYNGIELTDQLKMLSANIKYPTADDIAMALMIK